MIIVAKMVLGVTQANFDNHTHRFTAFCQGISLTIEGWIPLNQMLLTLSEKADVINPYSGRRQTRRTNRVATMAQKLALKNYENTLKKAIYTAFGIFHHEIFSN